MVLNYIWIGFFLIAFVIACIQLFVFGNVQVFSDMLNSTFDSAKSGFEISLGLTGVLSLWLGIMKVGERGGVIRAFSKIVAPFFEKIFPDLPKNHPAYGSMFMNIAANMLGLDNAATPLGLKAMKEMQESNPVKDTASNPMIMFLVLNTSGLTLIPVTIMVYRAQLGAANPSDIFLPILIATFFSTLVGFLCVAAYQKINILDKTVLGTLAGLIIVVGSMLYFFGKATQNQIALYSNFIASFVLISIIISFILAAMIHKVNVYDAFIEGAKDGFQVAIGIIPYLIAILVAIGMFRAAGAMDMMIRGFSWFFESLGLNTDFVGALPTALMKPLSGSGARGMMVDAMKLNGADSFVGRLSCIIQGSTDTTFYILAVYFGSVGIKNTRYAVICGLIADFAGVVAAILIGYLFFH
ncbi:MAG TPA: nucleoside recognition domain-containing protein [Paludibacteraceae bacterium]|nr:spore maturation protein [Paludibacteraceae bacterium]HOH55153.1 nucleoside recognition domain-containing protein [Paludibacteraceae bacterium]